MNDLSRQSGQPNRGRRRFLRSPRPVFIARAPGRLDLMGGNDDYTGGMVFEATIREATWAAVQVRRDRRIVFCESADGGARLASTASSSRSTI